MAARNPKVTTMVEEALAADRNTPSQTLFDRAVEIDPSIAEMSRRQFHAQYPLQVKRALGGSTGGRKGARKSAGGKRGASKRAAGKRAAEAAPGRGRRGGAGDGREAIRRALVEFATAFAEAETRTEIVRVLGGVDAYVDRIERLNGR